MRDAHHCHLQSSGFKAPASDCGPLVGPPRPALVIILIAIVKIFRARAEPFAESSNYSNSKVSVVGAGANVSSGSGPGRKGGGEGGAREKSRQPTVRRTPRWQSSSWERGGCR